MAGTLALGLCKVLLLVTMTQGLQIIDMSHLYNENTPYWPAEGNIKYNFTIGFRGEAPNGIWMEANTLETGEHSGTHIDAPAHMYKGAWRLHELPLERLVARPAVIINITARAAEDPDAAVTAADLKEWESAHGQIPEGAVVFMDSGWAKYAMDQHAFQGSDNTEDISSFHFPGFSKEAADWLVANREIYGVGTDTLSLDIGSLSLTLPAHTTFFERNIYGMECLNNLDKLPPAGAIVTILPMNIYDGSGGPSRVIAMIDDSAGNGSGSAMKQNLAVMVTVFVVAMTTAFF